MSINAVWRTSYHGQCELLEATLHMQEWRAANNIIVEQLLPVVIVHNIQEAAAPQIALMVKGSRCIDEVGQLELKSKSRIVHVTSAPAALRLYTYPACHLPLQLSYEGVLIMNRSRRAGREAQRKRPAKKPA